MIMIIVNSCRLATKFQTQLPTAFDSAEYCDSLHYLSLIVINNKRSFACINI